MSNRTPYRSGHDRVWVEIRDCPACGREHAEFEFKKDKARCHRAGKLLTLHADGTVTLLDGVRD
jgi:hypothetical protein